MAVLFTSYSEIDSVVDACSGYYLAENLTGSGNILVRDIIDTDYLSVQPIYPDLFITSAVYAPVVFVQEFNPLITKMFGGNPPVYRFGSIVADHLNTKGQRQFIQYEKQQFPILETIVTPEPVGLPDTMSALPPTEAYELLTRAPLFSNRQFFGKSSDYMSALFFSYDLEPGVVANIGFFYYAFVNISGSSGASTILLVGM